MKSLILAAGLLIAACQAESNPRMPALDAHLEAFESAAMFNGAVIIDRGGRIIHDATYGYADYAHSTPFGPETRFKLASLSKPMTAAAIAVLVEQGALDLDATVERWLPDYPHASRIRLIELVEHTAGVPHVNALPWGDAATPIGLEETVRRLSDLPLDFEPGETRRYSNGGYALLARILEQASGRPYGEAMRSLVFDRLGMTGSGHIGDSRAVIPHLARGYEPGRRWGARRISRGYFVESRTGGGSLYATVGDVRRFFNAIYREDFPSAAVNQRLFGDGADIRFSTGRSPGGFVGVMHDPAEDVLIISLANNYAADFQWLDNLHAIATGAEPIYVGLPARDASPDSAAEDAMIGLYRYENEGFSQALEIRRGEDGGLVLTDYVSDASMALTPLERGAWLEPLFFGLCRPVDASADRISCSRVHDRGFTADWVRREPPEE